LSVVWVGIMLRSKEARTRVLVIAMANSIHTARWLSQFRDKSVDIVLFPSTPSRTIHPMIIDLISGDIEMNLQIAPWMKRLAYPLGLLDIFFGNNFRSVFLRKIILGKRSFSVIHAMELQHAGYLLLRAKRYIPNSTRVIVSNWGSDIYWFQRFPRHKRKLESLMSIATHYSCECNRDVSLAHGLGFKGVSFPVQPNAGAFSDDSFLHASRAAKPSTRKLIMIKGYTWFVGRADLALQACQIVGEGLRSYEIVLYSSDIRSRRFARRIARDLDLNVTIYKKHQLSHEEMLELFRRARIYIGISESDGISTSLLDAISSGCFPIQTNTSCADEWITDGRTGFLVDYTDLNGIAGALSRAVTDNELVDRAAIENVETARARLSTDAMRTDIDLFYR